jgi:hypothetical protein
VFGTSTIRSGCRLCPARRTPLSDRPCHNSADIRWRPKTSSCQDDYFTTISNFDDYRWLEILRATSMLPLLVCLQPPVHMQRPTDTASRRWHCGPRTSHGVTQERCALYTLRRGERIFSRWVSYCPQLLPRQSIDCPKCWHRVCSEWPAGDGPYRARISS